jgi:recombinational DNA repair ATPase RecF
MIVSRVEVRNFRSTVEASTDPPSFSNLVGQNNHGTVNKLEI